MNYKTIVIVAGLMMSTSMLAAPVTAAGLLGNTLGGVADVKSGPAGSDSLVNVGLGGGNGNIADVKLGGSTGLSGSANVSSNGGLDAEIDVGLGGLGVSGDVDIGDGLGVDIDVGLGGGGNGGNGGPGGPSGPGGPGLPGGNGGMGDPLRYANIGDSLTAQCSLGDGRQILQLAASAKVSTSIIAGWQRAANVQIVPMRLCPAARAQVSQILRGSPKINALQGAVAADMLISASLSRTSYDANDVFAVQRNGGALTVYVF